GKPLLIIIDGFKAVLDLLCLHRIRFVCRPGKELEHWHTEAFTEVHAALQLQKCCRGLKRIDGSEAKAIRSAQVLDQSRIPVCGGLQFLLEVNKCCCCRKHIDQSSITLGKAISELHKVSKSFPLLKGGRAKEVEEQALEIEAESVGTLGR